MKRKVVTLVVALVLVSALVYVPQALGLSLIHI
jgi:hypothetical protein